MDSVPIVQSGKPYRPFTVKAMNSIGRYIRKMGINAVQLNPDKLMEDAVRKTGCSDFGNDDFEKGMRLFIESLEKEGELNFLGRVIAQSYTGSNLANRLLILERRKNNPRVQDERIEAPLLIVGLPRTGTTILHALLDQDPANRSPLFWEVDYPDPPPLPETWETDSRIARQQKTLDNLYRMAPDFRAMHPMTALMPQECAAVFTLCFRSEQLQTQFNVPSYQAWLDDAEMESTYKFHRMFLQHLQSGGVRGERWLLKSPAHFARLDYLFREYPDARVIHTHRNPIDVCASVSSMTATLRGMSSDAIDLKKVGAQQLDWWTKTVEKSLRNRKKMPDKNRQIFDVEMKELVSDPLGTIKRIYDFFNMELTEYTEAAMNAYLTENSRNKYGSHTYSLSDFGLNRERDKHRFDEYVSYYGLEEAKTPYELSFSKS